MPSANPRRFAIGLSFPGEHRDYVERIARALLPAFGGEEAGKARVFYDDWHKGKIIGYASNRKLEKIYAEDVDLVVPFYCQDYSKKNWCGVELRAIEALLFDQQYDRVLPFRFDMVDIPSSFKTDIFLVVSSCPPEEIAQLILERYKDLQEGFLKLASTPTAAKAEGAEAIPVTRRKCKLSCKEIYYDSLHLRNAAFLTKLCRTFPKTEFRIFRQGTKPDEEAEFVNPKNMMEIVLGMFEHGEEVMLEVRGELQVMAAEFFKVAWENLEGYSDDVEASRARLISLIDRTWEQVFEPDLLGIGLDHVSLISEDHLIAQGEEHRCVATINDRLHNLSLPMLPLIAKHFGCDLQISFELPERGVYSFTMDPANNYELDRRILDLQIEVGTRVTVLASGQNREAAGDSVRDVLQSLWQCDEWVRRRAKDFDAASAVPELLEFAKEMRRLQTNEYVHIQSPFISNLLTQRTVFVNPARLRFSKQGVLDQLATAHARMHGLEVASVLERVQDAERRQPVVLRPGFAVAHGAMDRSPRISVAFGVYPDGVEWSEDETPAKLVAMVICARDTYGTWRDYMQRFAILFRSNPALQAQLVATRGTAEFRALLRKSETVAVNT